MTSDATIDNSLYTQSPSYAVAFACSDALSGPPPQPRIHYQVSAGAVAKANEDSPHLPLLAPSTDMFNTANFYSSSTENGLEPSILLTSKLAQLFDNAEDERFEDGMESEFSRNLNAIVAKHGEQALKALSGIIHSKSTCPETSGEALRWVGRVRDRRTFRYRFWLLTNGLRSASARVRDGALLGLAFMNSKMAIPHLIQAAEAETCADLRSDMLQLVDLLRASSCGETSANYS